MRTIPLGTDTKVRVHITRTWHDGPKGTERAGYIYGGGRVLNRRQGRCLNLSEDDDATLAMQYDGPFYNRDRCGLYMVEMDRPSRGKALVVFARDSELEVAA